MPLGSTAAAVDPVSWPSGLDPFVEEIVPVPVLDLADSSLAYPDLALAWKASYGVVVAVVAAVAAAAVVAGAFAAVAVLKAGFASVVAVAAVVVAAAVVAAVVAVVVVVVADYASNLASALMTVVLEGRKPAKRPHPLALRLSIPPALAGLPSLFAGLD